MLRCITRAVDLNPCQTCARHIDGISTGQRDIQRSRQHHTNNTGVTHQKHMLPSMRRNQIQPGGAHPRMEFVQRLCARRPILDRILLEARDDLRIIGANLLGGLTFPNAKSDLHETRIEAQGQVHLLRQFACKSLAAL